MQRAQFGPWEIEYDREATRAAYARMETWDCECQGCRNYVANTSCFPEEVQQFFDTLGVDPTSPSKLDAAIATGGAFWYDGSYHIVGRYVSGHDWNCTVPMTPEEIEKVPFRSENENTQYFRPLRIPYNFTEDFSVGFTQELLFVPKEIPEAQALQLEFSFTLPWLLDEPYEE